MNGVRKNKKKLLRPLIPVWICFVIGCLRLLTMTCVSGQSSFSDLVEGYAARMFRSFDERSENIREVEWYGTTPERC